MKLIEVDSQQSLAPDASSPAEAIELPEGAPENEALYLHFDGTQGEQLTLMSAEGATAGIPIPPGREWVVGPISPLRGTLQFLRAPIATSVTVTVLRAEGDGNLWMGPPDETVAGGGPTLSAEFAVLGVSPSGSWTWEAHRPDEDFQIRALNGLVEETNGSAVEVAVYGTNKDSPATPSGADPDDWEPITEAVQTVPANEEIELDLAANYEQIAVGLNGSGTAHYEFTATGAGGALDDRDHDAGSDSASSSLPDGASLSVNLSLAEGESIVYVAKSDSDYTVEVTHYAGTRQSGDVIVQTVSGGTVTGGNVDGNKVATGGQSAVVTLTDQSSDNADATATLLAKVVK